jgi:hypothetical protein
MSVGIFFKINIENRTNVASFFQKFFSIFDFGHFFFVQNQISQKSFEKNVTKCHSEHNRHKSKK